MIGGLFRLGTSLYPNLAAFPERTDCVHSVGGEAGMRRDRSSTILRGRGPLPISFLRSRLLAGPLSIVLALAVLSLITLPGCSGCRSDVNKPKTAAEKKKEEEEKEKAKKKKLAEQEKKKEKPKPNYQSAEARVRPTDQSKQPQRAKPGHWFSVSQTFKANNFEFRGDLVRAPTSRSNQPVDLPQTPYRLSLSRPVELPKRQAKRIEMPLFVPADATRPRFGGGLATGGTREVYSTPTAFLEMKPHEFFFVVLAREPDRHGYLKILDSVRPPLKNGIPYNHVIYPTVGPRISLPESALNWTTVSYLFIDELDPSLLSDRQQGAILDWLHWGGQILISGPGSLELLRGSFLEPYLPVAPGESWNIEAADVAQLSDAWMPTGRGQSLHPIEVKQPWPGITMELTEPTEGTISLASSPEGKPLVVERYVGRGRIVVTAFRMYEQEIRAWSGFDMFFNACMMRHGPRMFERGTDFDRKDFAQWYDKPNRDLDPQLVTRLRYFSRDLGYRYRPPKIDDTMIGIDPTDATPLNQKFGAWNDFSAVPNSARKSLQEAAGIKIPDSSFVIYVLAGYLTLLVPVNWLIFRVLGRIEWAWVLAPIMALGCTFVVARLASFDIGFVRAQTELSVIEMQAGYPRAHTSRFIALYTSFSTPYSFTFEEPDAFILPFSVNPKYRKEMGVTHPTVTYRRGEKTTLTGFSVQSNSTSEVRSEQMIDLGGSVDVFDTEGPRPRVVNRSRLELRNAAVVRKTAQGELEAAWIGNMSPDDVALLDFEAVDEKWLPGQWKERLDGGQPEVRTHLDLTSFAVSASQNAEFQAGDMRLFAGANDPELPGLTVEPNPSQTKSTALVVVNLRTAREPAPRRDHRSRADLPKRVKPTVDDDFFN